LQRSGIVVFNTDVGLCCRCVARLNLSDLLMVSANNAVIV
jgi:hypothetical protein